ncbi:TPA: hypothetical protein VL936_000599 [Streptococcus pyogenes]|nr:hypothetical protein [Streptococcus pyogenes]
MVKKNNILKRLEHINQKLSDGQGIEESFDDIFTSWVIAVNYTSTIDNTLDVPDIVAFSQNKELRDRIIARVES